VHAGRHQRLGILAGMFNGSARGFVDPDLIINGLVVSVTQSPYLVALVAFINKAAALAPQLLVSTRIEHFSRRRPQFVAVIVVRAIAQLALVVSIWLLARRVNAVSLTLFFGSFLLTWFCAGSAQVIFMDMVGRLIPHERMGTFFGYRSLGGLIAVVITSLLITQPILSHVEEPYGYVWLAVLGGVLTVCGMIIWSLCQEGEGPRAEHRTTLRQSLRRGFGWLKSNRNYRCVFLLRIAFRFCYLGLAFFILFGRDQLRGGQGEKGVQVLGGIMVATITLSQLGSSAVWGRASDRRGTRICLVLSALLLIVAPLLALLAPTLPRVFSYRVPGITYVFDLRIVVYLLALAALGAGTQGNILGVNRFMVTTAPPHRRASYLGFANTAASPLTLLPFFGAWLADTGRMTTVFLLVAGGGVLALLASLAMQPESKSTPEQA